MISVVNRITYTSRKLLFRGFLCFIAISLSLYSCTPSAEKNTSLAPILIQGEAQGTTYHISYFSDSNFVSKVEVDSILQVIDKAASIWDSTSLISTFNQSQDSINPVPNTEIGSIFIANFNRSKLVYRATDGAYNPTVGELVNGWGFGFKNRENMDSSRVATLLRSVGFSDDQMRLTENETVFEKSNVAAQIDFNGIAQGYSVDYLAVHFHENGIHDFMIEVGGELTAHGTKPNGESWKIGVDKPVEGNLDRELMGTLSLKDLSIATSGNYRKFYESDGVKYSHTINPITGYPVNHRLLSATVVMEDCALADAYATSFMVLGTNKAIRIIEREKDLEGILVYSDSLGNLETYFSKGLENIYLPLD